MICRSILRFSIVVASIGLIGSSIVLRAQGDNSRHGRKYKAPPPSAHIEVTVLKANNGKPIENAHVIFHPIEGDKDKGSMELKTNEDGKIVLDVIPIGDTVRLQVIANGFQTYGQDFKIDKPEMSMEVRMKRPGRQYSIYNQPSADSGSDKGSGSGNNPGADKSSNPAPDAAPPASGEKPSGSDSKPEAHPNADQPQPPSR